MKTIMQKIEQQRPLAPEEYAALHAYTEDLRWHDPIAYRAFYQSRAEDLACSYAVFLPRYSYGRDDFYDYLLQNPELAQNLTGQVQVTETFPLHLHEYLLDQYGNFIDAETLQIMQEALCAHFDALSKLPAPRQKDPVYKYEDNNQYKEPGLKNHFERIGRYNFVTRIQSYRYLRGSKSVNDKIEVISPDCLGGIFTNKEKSIYYYIFLTEENESKAINACRVLNRSLYGK